MSNLRPESRIKSLETRLVDTIKTSVATEASRVASNFKLKSDIGHFLDCFSSGNTAIMVI